MMRYDGAALRVLYIGGTGTISTSCVRLSVESGMSVFVLNRGNNSAGRDMPKGVTWLTGDVTDDASLLAAIGDQRFDAVVNFLSYDADDVHRMVAMFGSRTRQYVHISSGPSTPSPCGSHRSLSRRPSHRTRCSTTPRQVAGGACAAAGPNRAGLPGHDCPALAYLRRRQPARPGRLDGRGPDRQRRGNPGTRGRNVAVDADPRRGLRPGARRPARQPEEHRGGLQHHRRGRLHLGPDLHHHRRRLASRPSSCTWPPSCSRWWHPTGSGRARCSATSATPGVRHEQDPAVRARLRAKAHVPPGRPAHGPVAGRSPEHDRR